MSKKPTYEELEQRIKELENEIAELKGAGEAIRKSELRLKEVEQLAQLGHWELDLVTNTLYWSDEIYRIFNLDPHKFGATYEALLDAVHPDDRKFVDKAFKDSVKNKTGYDIVNKLLLRNGTIKYVHEKCQTIYDADGKPLRSIGTVQDITKRKQEEHSFAGIIGRDVKIREIFETIREVAEVADLSKPMQAKLLRVLQEGTFERVGSEKTISTDARIISAANRNLKQEMEKGNFRDDLYYRLSVIPMYLPPLRNRKNDIPLLVEYFLEKAAIEGQNTDGMSKDALSIMVDYSWPGNV